MLFLIVIIFLLKSHISSSHWNTRDPEHVNLKTHWTFSQTHVFAVRVWFSLWTFTLEASVNWSNTFLFQCYLTLFIFLSSEVAMLICFHWKALCYYLSAFQFFTQFVQNQRHDVRNVLRLAPGFWAWFIKRLISVRVCALVHVDVKLSSRTLNLIKSSFYFLFYLFIFFKTGKTGFQMEIRPSCENE